MTEGDPLSPELAERVETLLGQANGFVGAAQAFARRARELGVGLVDPGRHRSWIDETVHQGALFRLNFWRKLAEAREPVPMILFCPKCGTRHIDQPDPANGWDKHPHRSHLCASCGLIWRPADICTVGVEKIETRGRLDVPIEDLEQRGDGKIVQMPALETAGFVGLVERISRKVINDVGDAFARNRIGGYRR